MMPMAEAHTKTGWPRPRPQALVSKAANPLHGGVDLVVNHMSVGDNQQQREDIGGECGIANRMERQRGKDRDNRKRDFLALIATLGSGLQIRLDILDHPNAPRFAPLNCPLQSILARGHAVAALAPFALMAWVIAGDGT